jgi:hypothetical protein
MKVVSYSNVVPSKNKSQEKSDILIKFIKGVNAAGDTGIIHTGYNVVDSDVAIIQGWQHERGKNAPHLQLRQQVIDTQLDKKKFVCTADSNLFLYANKSNEPYHYLRYSLNGVFPNTGQYFDDNPDPTRWEQIQRDANINLQSQKTTGKNIVLCCQRNGGWSMGSEDVTTWVRNTVSKIRKYSDRPIVVRPHPGDKQAIEYFNPRTTSIRFLHNVTIGDFNSPLDKDLKNAWCVVNHNSSSIVGPVIQGYPAFITDPIKSQCAEVTHHSFEFIENPKEFDRIKWLQRISMFHWKFSELEDGTAWKHIRRYCQ